MHRCARNLRSSMSPTTPKGRAQLWTVTLLVAFCIWAANAGWAQAGCGSTITKCGCTITAPGLYSVTPFGAKLDASQGLTSNGDCIDIAAKHVTLDLKNATMTGAGSGDGIKILRVSDHAAVTRAFITGWNIGIEVSADHPDIWDIDVEKSAASGIVFNGVTNGNLWLLSSDEGGGAGVLLKDGGSPPRHSDGNHIFDSDFNGNSTGLKLSSASRNRIDDCFAFDNHDTGIGLGGSSNNNHLIFNGVGGAGEPGTPTIQNFGIFIASGSTGNVMGENDTRLGGPNLKFDGDDENGGCAGNTWFNNSSGSPPPAPAFTGNQPCVLIKDF